MRPKISHIHLAFHAYFSEIHRHRSGIVAAIKQCKHIIAILHLSIPYLIFLVTKSIIAPLLAVALPFCFAWDAANEIGMFARGKE